MRRPSNQTQPGPITTKMADKDSGRKPQEQGEKSEVVPAQGIRRETDKPKLEPVPAEVGKGVDTTLKPFNRADPIMGASKKVVGGGDIIASLVSALASKEGVAIQKALDRMMVIFGVVQTAVDVVTQNNAEATDLQWISDSVLQILKAFIFVVTAIVNVHPHVRIALGILTIAAQLLVNRENMVSEVSGVLDTVRHVYEFLMKLDSVRNIHNVKEALGKIALVANDAAQFITSHSNTESWNNLGKNLHSETQAIVGASIKSLNGLMQQYRDRSESVRDTQTNTRRVPKDMAHKANVAINNYRKNGKSTKAKL